MTRYKKHHRIIATIFLLIFFPTLVPNNLFASTSGPAAPEAASFEPVDATDMVNLATGDLSYVMPLIDVPSPEGGYPLTLSYHAGVAIDQDASWVGLGWSLNPGAINRSISGFPDDWKEEKTSSIVYDSGGEVTSHDFSIGVGWGDGMFSAGLYGSYSENKAFGGQNSYNFDGGVYGSVGVVKGSIGSDGASLGLGYGTSSGGGGGLSISGSASIGIYQSFKTGSTSFSVSGGVGLSGESRAKMNSTGTSTGSSSETNFKGSVGIGSVSYTGSNRGNNNSSYSTIPACYPLALPLSNGMFSINYSYNKIRYSLFDTKSYSGVGTLYAENMTNVKNNSLFVDKEGFDTYVANYDQTDESLLGNSIVLPAYDFYSVSAQGLAGDISPKIFEYGTLTPKQSVVNNQGKSKYSIYINKNSFTRKLDSDNVHFYFNNAYESYVNIESDLWDDTPPPPLNSVRDFSSINSPSSRLTSSLTIDGVNYNGYNAIKNRKKGASYIETYTNGQIISNQNLVYKINNFNRDVASIPKDGIGAFKITAADGKTYHYSLPVYQREKFARYGKYGEDIDNKFYEEFQVAPYATHWLLTAITGSDFVDDGDGTISDKDLGYWVTFDYGKWSDGYTWRTPRGGEFKTTPTSKIYEWGVKEIYYLNAVKTRTHTALFVKSEREDGKSIPDSKDKEFISFGVTSNKSLYSDKTKLFHFDGIGSDSPGMSLWQVASLWATHKVKMDHNKVEHKLLKLDKIIVVKNKDLPINFRYSNPNEALPKVKSVININEAIHIQDRDGFKFWDKPYAPVYNKTWSGEYYGNVLDNGDINYYFSNIEKVSNKIIEFDHGYSLAQGTPNTINSTLGRLTLNKITYKGKNGVQVLPPYKFEYENPAKVYNIDNTDDWGYNKGDIASWNLNKITDPNGANILMKYEEDDYYTEAVKYETQVKDGLKFKFYRYSDKLRFDVENLDPSNSNKINFASFYDINKKAKINVWACLKHEYTDWKKDCHHRDGSVNINDELTDVVAVDNDKVTFETDLSNTTDGNDGLNWICGTQYSYEMDRLQAKKRNECPDLTGGCSERTAYTLYYSINSNKIYKDQNGGGLRVKQITVNSFGENYNTNYYYNQDGFDKNKGNSNYKSSGITSYAPSKYGKNIKYMAELPPPSVMYSTVTVETNQDINKYYFKTISPEVESNGEYFLGDILHIKKQQSQNDIPIVVPGYVDPKLSKYKYVVENNFSMLGALLKQEKYNKSNQLLKRVENNYKPTSNILQGLNKETFNSYKITYYKDNDGHKGTFDLNVSSKMTYPSVVESVKTFENGAVNSIFYDKYDFLTGQVLEKTSVSSDGQSFKTKTIPAYIKYPEMGSKVDNINNKNMLSQTAVDYSYILDKVSNTWKETGVGITTWSNIWSYKDVAGTTVSILADAPANQKIWRKHKSYVWNGVKDVNGIFENYDTTTGSGDDKFDWNIGIGSQPAQWKQTSEVTLYDHYSAPLETKDINGNYASTKMGDNDTKVMATGNARYGEMFYAGAENITGSTNWLESEVKMTNATRTTDRSHTGKQSVAITATSEFGVEMKSGEHKAGKYKVSVWVDKSAWYLARIKDNGKLVEFTESYKAGDWVLMSGYVNVPSGAYSIYITTASGDYKMNVDDLMIRPVASSMTGYVYNEWDELTYIIGNNGLATRFDYDAAGRLISTYSEVIDDEVNKVRGGFRIAKSNTYNHKYL